jgi:hypothetical protein
MQPPVDVGVETAFERVYDGSATGDAFGKGLGGDDGTFVVEGLDAGGAFPPDEERTRTASPALDGAGEDVGDVTHLDGLSTCGTHGSRPEVEVITERAELFDAPLGQRRHRGHRQAERVAKHALGIHRPAALVDEAVVTATEQEQVRQVGGAAVGPVLDMVCLEKARVRAPREPAGGVTAPQRTPKRAGDRARLPSHAEWALGAFEQRDERGIAGEAPDGLPGDGRPVLQDRDPRLILAQRGRVDVDDDLIAIASGSPRIAGE